MRVNEITPGLYEGKDGGRREVVDVWEQAGLLDWRKPGSTDGPRTSIAAFARWAARKLIPGEEVRMSFNISLVIIAACFVVSLSGLALGLVASFPHDGNFVIFGGALVATIVGYLTANALRNS